MQTEPEIVDGRHQRFLGKLYFLTPGERYFKRAIRVGGKDKILYLHRVVWEAHHGALPPGRKWHVHHKNGDKLDNRPENLDLLPARRHIGEHMTSERRERLRTNINRVRPLASAWHGSPEGREWHSEAAKRSWSKRQPTRLICQQCGQEYETLHPAHSKFCHLKCKMAALRTRRGVKVGTVKPHETALKTCPICGAAFEARVRRPAETCSDRCRRALRSLESGQRPAATFTT